MSARLIETEPGASFRAQCDCSGEWRDLLEVEGAAEGFTSWNYCHGLGGLTLTCTGCQSDYVLGGQVEGHGLPDLIEGAELYELPRLELTPLQRRCLDISLTAEETLWQKSMELVRGAKAAGDPAQAESLWIAAKLLRGALHREKRETIRAILLEHGIEDVPPSLRIARTSDGLGVIYDVSRGPLPMRARTVAPEEVREVDLSEWAGPEVEPEIPLRREGWGRGGAISIRGQSVSTGKLSADLIRIESGVPGESQVTRSTNG